jgi:hypothetical protein
VAGCCGRGPLQLRQVGVDEVLPVGCCVSGEGYESVGGCKIPVACGWGRRTKTTYSERQ